MKSKKQKRDEAAVRAEGYCYENSKAKRQGIPEEKWQEQRASYIQQCAMKRS